MRPLALLCALCTGCYEPEAVDCTVECSAADECADGQVCGADHFCAAPEIAGACGMTNSDEPQMVSLVVAIDGDGKVTVEGFGNCDSDSPSQGTCTFSVPAGVMRRLKAVEDDDREFVSWTSTCAGSSSSCTVTPVMSLTHVGAKFE
jgi:hypothetical protein